MTEIYEFARTLLDTEDSPHQFLMPNHRDLINDKIKWTVNRRQSWQDRSKWDETWGDIFIAMSEVLSE